MKFLIPFFLIQLCSFDSFSQNYAIDDLRKHYCSIDIDSLVISYEKLYMKNRDSIFSELHINNNRPIQKPFNFQENKPVLIVETYFSETIKDYNQSDEISSFCKLSPNPNHLAYLNKSNKLVAFIYYTKMSNLEEVSIYELNKSSFFKRIVQSNETKCLRKLSYNLRHAVTAKPDAIIINMSLVLHTKTVAVIIIRNSQMLIYSKKRRKPLDMNAYIRNHFNEEETRNLSKLSNVLGDPDVIIMK